MGSNACKLDLEDSVPIITQTKAGGETAMFEQWPCLIQLSTFVAKVSTTS
jgi:hypothetical protein